jgi:DNA modification methylase
MNNNYRIFNRNSLEFIKTMRDNSVDFIFTDPPYNISQYSTGNIRFNYFNILKAHIYFRALTDIATLFFIKFITGLIAKL